ncbi:MAG: hypothetical protein KME15_27035 [Drouetiella hepatica Uher 2000/2452]|uniref:Uncharacterized protein n=1 Tax=Drouetiella hepatica Uher 2000/2452 TaxID=904376 RepID=A0A951QGT0_9CYAN|nr:hypothetical protein [Drouetiella hepatica Uher 2000/2452]
MGFRGTKLHVSRLDPNMFRGEIQVEAAHVETATTDAIAAAPIHRPAHVES